MAPLEGAWPPGKRKIVLERHSPEYLGVGIGDSLTIDLYDGSTKTLRVVGIAHNPQVHSPDVSDTALGLVTPETLELLGLGDAYTELHIRVANGALQEPYTADKASINSVVDEVEDQEAGFPYPAIPIEMTGIDSKRTASRGSPADR